MKQICRMTQTGLKKALTKFLHNNYKTVYQNKSYVIAEGDIPVALVAHMDTVFNGLPEEIYYDEIEKVMWSPQGLGADDRAGVYAILQIINKGYRPSIIFTTDEEIGCVGASNLVKDFRDCPFKELKYIIQLDRRGKNDCVFYNCDNKDFIKYVEKFGFKESWGSFSDISRIAPAWGVAAVNLSIGYEDEHDQIERLFVKNMEKTIKKVTKMLDDIDLAPSFTYIEKKYTYNYYGKYKGQTKRICEWCGSSGPDVRNQIHFGRTVETVCDLCFNSYMQWNIPCINDSPQDE